MGSGQVIKMHFCCVKTKSLVWALVTKGGKLKHLEAVSQLK